MYRVGGKGLSFRLRGRYRWLLVVSCCHMGLIADGWLDGSIETLTSDIHLVMVYEMHIPLIPNDVVPPATAAKACSI